MFIVKIIYVTAPPFSIKNSSKTQNNVKDKSKTQKKKCFSNLIRNKTSCFFQRLAYYVKGFKSLYSTQFAIVSSEKVLKKSESFIYVLYTFVRLLAFFVIFEFLISTD